MLINSPLSNLEECAALLDAGADMFYCGVDFESVLGLKNIVSNRWPWRHIQFKTDASISAAAGLIHKNKKKVVLTVNEHSYLPGALAAITGWLRRNMIFDGVIVSDVGVALALKAEVKGISLVASNGMNIFNTGDVRFFKTLGMDTQILPRAMNINEVTGLVRENRDVRFEFLIMNHDCYFNDGMCRFFHQIYDFHGCHSGFYKRGVPEDNGNHVAHLWELEKAGLYSVKIVGRIDNTEKKLKDILLLTELRKLFVKSKEEFESGARDLLKKYYE
jgi:collagenase-like PrtC family protease